MRAFGVATLGVLLALFLWQFYATLDAATSTSTAQRIERAPRVAGEATLLFAGDTAETDAATETLAKEGLHWPFAATRALVTEADLAVVNLEAPITDAGTPFPLYERYQYRAPVGEAEALAWAGFDVGTLANNHARDYGASGLADTRRHLADAGLAAIGGGANANEARAPLIVSVGQLRIGLLSYCEDQAIFRYYLQLFATGSRAGVARLSPQNLASDLAQLRPLVDIVVVILHMGDNYAGPSDDAVAASRRAIDLGADVVIAHHPHVTLPVVVYRGRPILLSIGNYAFGTPGRRELDYGMLALLHVQGRALDRVELAPLLVNNDRVHYQPRVPTDEEADVAVDALIAQSASAGTRLVRENGRAVLLLPATSSGSR